MRLKNISKWILITGVLLIWVVKFFVRPYIHIPFFLRPLIDVAPNLIGSFLLPFGACWLPRKYYSFQNPRALKVICITGLMLVVADEYLQLIPFFGRTFDYLDIIFSFIGAFAGYKTFSYLMLKHARPKVFHQSL